MSRNGRWFACAVLLLGAPGCLGTSTVDVGVNEAALSADLASDPSCASVARELQTGDCAQAGRLAESLGHDVVWSMGGGIPADLAVLEIDGLVSCSAPSAELTLHERSHAVHVTVSPLAARPDPEPARPDESRPDPEPASPDANRPDPEPATGSVDSGDDTDPDENRPDPEPAGGGVTTVSTSF